MEPLVVAETRRLGVAPIGRAPTAFLFVCPTCARRYRYDSPVEPLCTGPNDALDEHEPTVMTRLPAGS